MPTQLKKKSTRVPFALDKLLLEQRLTVTELAEKVDLSREAIYGIYTAKTITIRALRKLEDGLGDCTNYLRTN